MAKDGTVFISTSTREIATIKGRISVGGGGGRQQGHLIELVAIAYETDRTTRGENVVRSVHFLQEPYRCHALNGQW